MVEVRRVDKMGKDTKPMNPFRLPTPSAFLITCALNLLSLRPAEANAPEPWSRATALEQQSQLWQAAQQLHKERPAWAEQVNRAWPSRSRTGSLVFSPSQIADPAAATLLLARSGRHPDAAFRRAVAEALPETHSSELGALIAVELALESEPEVRVSLAHALRYAEDSAAAQTLMRAAQDSDAQVRETALRSMRAHPQASLFAASILRALEDQEPRVQAAALRAWGSLRDPKLQVDLEAWLRADSAKLRLAALRGQWRVDRAIARQWVERLDLDQDPAPKVARMAQRVLSGD